MPAATSLANRKNSSCRSLKLLALHGSHDIYEFLSYDLEFPQPIMDSGVPYIHISQNSHLLLYPSLWLLVPGLSSHFCYYFFYNLLLRSAIITIICLRSGYKILKVLGTSGIRYAGVYVYV